MMPTFRLSDAVYGALPSASIEIIYLDLPDAALTLQPSPEAMKSATGVAGVMPGPVPVPIMTLDYARLKRIQDEAQIALTPYQDVVTRIDAREKLYRSVTSTLIATPALARATITRMAQPPQTGEQVETHDIALSSKAQIVIVISGAAAAIRYDGAAVGASLQLEVYAKPHPTQAILQDHHQIYSHTMPPQAPTTGYDLTSNLKMLFADGGKPLSADFDSTLAILDDKLRYYFHAIDQSPQLPTAAGQ